MNRFAQACLSPIPPLPLTPIFFCSCSYPFSCSCSCSLPPEPVLTPALPVQCAGSLPSHPAGGVLLVMHSGLSLPNQCQPSTPTSYFWEVSSSTSTSCLCSWEVYLLLLLPPAPAPEKSLYYYAYLLPLLLRSLPSFSWMPALSSSPVCTENTGVTDLCSLYEWHC